MARASKRDVQVADEFADLARRWHDETDDVSVTGRIVSHPAYLRIVAMGPPAVPLILRDLRDNGGFWFSALEAILNVCPGTPEERGKPRLMREAWLRWGRSHGYDV
jgi:hypothetical protein